MLPSDNLKPPTQPMSRARGCLGFALLSAGLLTLIFGAAAVAGSRNGLYWNYEFEVERSLSGPSSSGSSFSSGLDFSPTTLSVWLMIGGAMLAGSIFVYRRNFSLRFMLICVFMIGILGMIPGKLVKPPLARMSMRCMFGKAIPAEDYVQIDRIEQAMNPALALATLPEQMQQELQLTPRTRVGNVGVNMVSNGAGEIAQGAILTISFEPDLTVQQREALTEFYAFYFELFCFEYAKAAGAIKDSTPSRPSVNGRFYKYQKEWEEKRASKEMK